MWSKPYYTITLLNNYFYESVESVESVDNTPTFTPNILIFNYIIITWV